MRVCLVWRLSYRNRAGLAPLTIQIRRRRRGASGSAATVAATGDALRRGSRRPVVGVDTVKIRIRLIGNRTRGGGSSIHWLY
ncbi:unnamed protein product [Phyllotreta striolata]|uniref:Uncharacterized protein n=1 Tax=Phyllotreta striolata TaxID=444603 RepID=A0A9N9TS48_PHYSR|nr:unnamed protein product [Phyllotreta striolata]